MLVVGFEYFPTRKNARAEAMLIPEAHFKLKEIPKYSMRKNPLSKVPRNAPAVFKA
jgi:hypothetical protein